MPSIDLEHPEPGVARITMNSIETRNAATPDLNRQLIRVIDEVLADDAVRAVVFTGAGGHFMAGGNVKGFGGKRDPLEIQASVRRTQSIVRRVMQGDKPWVAAVEGYAAGSGVGRAIMCDIVVGDENTKFVLPFTKVGMTPDLGLHITLGHRVGLAKARRMVLLNETVAGAEAEKIGLLDILAPNGEVQASAMQVATRLAAGPRGSMASLRRGFYVAAAAIDAVLEYEAGAMSTAMMGSESAEGAAAFLEKRKPIFP